MAVEEPSLADLVEALRVEQRGNWREGERIVTESYFALHPRLLADLTSALKMVYNEVLLREAEGDGPHLDEYVGRFPQFADQLPPLFEVHRALESDALLEAAANEVPSDQTLGWDESAAPGPWPTVAGYQILGELGRGGMGVVYKARQLALNRVVALKMILAGNLANGSHLARFRAEAQAVARLQHPNIVQIHEVGEQDGRPYFSLEFVDGPSLAQELNGTPRPARQAAGLIATLARAMHYAHQQGVIHRDLKPANILLAPVAIGSTQGTNPSEEKGPTASVPVQPFFSVADCLPKITDFGLAKQLDVGPEQTGSGTVLGTPSYMAPEQADGSARTIGPTADVYALGAILYELLSGRPPFKAATPLDTLRQVLSDEPVPLSRLSRCVPRDLNTICLKCLQKQPHQRYASALALAEDLERYLADLPIHARRTSWTGQLWRWCRRFPAVAALLLVLTCLLVTTAVGASWAALRLREEGNATRAQLRRTEKTEDDATRRLFEARLAQAQAGRLSRRVGQRVGSLDALAEATQIARNLNLPENKILELRNAAIACLDLPDLQIAREWDGWPDGSLTVDFDPALERYARVDRLGVVHLHHVVDGSEIVHFEGLGPGEAWPSFSPDGRFLALGHKDHRLQVWNLTGPQPVALGPAESNTLGRAFSPDSLRLAVGHTDGSIRLLELPSGRELRRLEGIPRAAWLAFHPKGRQLAVSCATGVRIYDVETGNMVAKLAQHIGAECVAWQPPDGKTLAVTGGDRIIHIWDVATCKPITQLKGHKADGIVFAYNHAGDLLASSCWDGNMRLWDPRTGQQLFNTHASAASLRFSSDDRFLAATGTHTKLRIWEVIFPSASYTLVGGPAAGPAPGYSGCAISPNGRLLALTMKSGVCFWDLPQRKELSFAPIGEAHSVVFESSHALLTGGPNSLLRWPIQEQVGARGRLRIGPPSRLLPFWGETISCSSDGRVVASSQGNGGLVLDQDHPDRPIPPLTPHADVRYIAVSPDGTWAATGSHWHTKVHIWAARTGKHEKELPVEMTSLVGFSPDGKWLATTGGGLALWEVGSWKPGKRIGGGAFAFSPDSRLLATEAGDGVIRLVDPDSGREYARLEDSNQEPAVRICFSPDGAQLVVLTMNGQSIHVWDLRSIRNQLVGMDLDWDLPSYPPCRRLANRIRSSPRSRWASRRRCCGSSNRSRSSSSSRNASS